MLWILEIGTAVAQASYNGPARRPVNYEPGYASYGLAGDATMLGLAESNTSLLPPRCGSATKHDVAKRAQLVMAPFSDSFIA